MSDRAVAEALEALEQELASGQMPEAAFLLQWRARFDAAAREAERGEAWPSLLARAHALGVKVDRMAGVLAERRDEIRRELEHQARGDRALKGYGSNLG